MSDAVIANTREVLQSSLDEVDDDDVKFKLRTALQFLEVLEEHESEVRTVLEDCLDEDDQVVRRLRELGYVE